MNNDLMRPGQPARPEREWLDCLSAQAGFWTMRLYSAIRRTDRQMESAARAPSGGVVTSVCAVGSQGAFRSHARPHRPMPITSSTTFFYLWLLIGHARLLPPLRGSARSRYNSCLAPRLVDFAPRRAGLSKSCYQFMVWVGLGTLSRPGTPRRDRRRQQGGFVARLTSAKFPSRSDRH
jgi:hypothetical protein